MLPTYRTVIPTWLLVLLNACQEICCDTEYTAEAKQERYLTRAQKNSASEL